MFPQTVLKKTNGDAGFTLVELLIVVAIIAILAAIAIPQFSAYRKRGYAAMINANTKDFFIASQAALVDNPGSTITCASAQAAGARLSSGVTCTTGDVTTASGSFVLTGTTGWGLGTNTATITFSGALSPAAV